MKQFDLSNLVISMGKSVEDAVFEMKQANVACELEELECTVTIETKLDVERVGIKGDSGQPLQIKGLRFLEIGRSATPRDLTVPSEIGTLTIRALFSPGYSD